MESMEFSFKKMISVLLFVLSFLACKAIDPFQTFLRFPKSCFEHVNDETCNTSLEEAFTPYYTPVIMNKPDTRITLFTPKNQIKGEPLHKCGGRLPPNSDFDPSVDTIVLIHGYADGVCRTAWMREMKLQFFKKAKYNVILVDWSWGNFMDLTEGGSNLKLVSEQLSFTLKNIMKEKKLTGDSFHIIGHSYGASTASFTAKLVKFKNPSYKVRRVTFLDPPLFHYSKLPESKRISHFDGKFVDVYHTSSGDCFPTAIGLMEPVGHADFYPNGGSIQNACYEYAFQSLLKNDTAYGIFSLIYPTLCFHLHSLQIFKASINPPNGLYIAKRCDNYEEFVSGACNSTEPFAVAGMDAEKYFPLKGHPRQKTKYYFDTEDSCPFSQKYKTTQ